MVGLMGKCQEKSCPVCIIETVRCRKLLHGRDFVWECRCGTSQCDLVMTFYLAVVTYIFKILSRLYPGNCKVYGVDTW